MSRGRKVVLGVAVAGIISLVGVGVFGYSFLHSGLPVYEAEMKLEGLQGEVGVHHTPRGVPYIAAVHESDLYFMQGYLHAKERMWQMELQRRVVQGRLSEVLGEDQLPADRFLKKLGLDRIAMQMLKNTSSEGRTVLEHYAWGVNAYLDKHPPSLEFRLLGFEPEPWAPRDSAGIISLMAFDLGSNWRAEAFRQALSDEVDPALLEEILPPYEGWEDPRVVDSEKAVENIDAGQSNADKLVSLLRATSLDHIYGLPRLGSNSWVISPEQSATGTAVLANDPHLSLGLPSIWYEIGLTLREEECDMDLYGWSIPGAPGVVIGHNRHIAWGLTNTGDTQDLFLEERHPDDFHRFKYEGEWYEAEVETAEIAVDGREEPELVEIVYTRHGPLISDDPPMSMRWAAYDAEASTLDAVLKINEAENWDEFKAALAYFLTPVQSIVYADVEGNIGFRVAGKLPIRKEGQGIMPSPGWEEGYGWEGFIPFEELPELYNPDGGYIATANNRVEPDDYPYLISLDNAPGYRKLRISEVLGESGEISVEDSKMLQTDWYNRHAAERLPGFLQVLMENSCGLRMIDQQVVDVLLNWTEEPVNARDSAGAAVFQVWYLNLMEEIFRGKMSDELYAEFLKQGYIAYNALEAVLTREESGWYPGGLEEPLINTFSSTVDELIEKMGEDPENWRWDQLQSITIKHDLGAAPLIGDHLFNRGPYPYGGDFMTVGRARYALDDPFKVINGAGLRFIAVMDREKITSEVVIAGGQSGHPLSPHYSDQLEAWLEGDYFRVQIPCDPELEWEDKSRFMPPSE